MGNNEFLMGIFFNNNFLKEGIKVYLSITL